MEGEVPGSLSTERLFKPTRSRSCHHAPFRTPKTQDTDGRTLGGRGQQEPALTVGAATLEDRARFLQNHTHSRPTIQPSGSAVLTRRTRTLRFTQKPARGCWQQLRSQLPEATRCPSWADGSTHSAHRDREHEELRGRDDTEETQTPVTKRRRPTRRRHRRLRLRALGKGGAGRRCRGRRWPGRGETHGQAPAFRATERLCLMQSWWIQDIT